MYFTSTEDFFKKAEASLRLSGEEEKALGQLKEQGDVAAREALVQGYLRFTADFVRRAPEDIRTLNTVYACVECLEKSVDRFDFTKGRERFASFLGNALRRCITRCIAFRASPE